MEEYRVGLPNGHTWVYHTKVKAENAALIARALAAMPSDPGRHHTSIGQYGQGMRLARELGYGGMAGGKKPNHMRIYNLLREGNLPRSPERREKLKEIAARVPDDWFETCPCLLDEQIKHAGDGGNTTEA